MRRSAASTTRKRSVSEIKLKQLENAAIEGLRRAFSTLRDDAVLPSLMSLPLGEVVTDIGTYAFELRVILKSGEPHS